MALGAVLFFAWTVRERTLEHADRLALLPLDDDEFTAVPETRSNAKTKQDDPVKS